MVPDHRRQHDRHLDQRVRLEDEVLAHLWPHHDNVNFFGTMTVDIDGTLGTLDTDRYRPLRHIPTTSSTG
jgi:hypothetical protein